MTDEEIQQYFDESLLSHTVRVGAQHYFGFYRVNFGVRIRGGVLGDLNVPIDICAGDSLHMQKAILGTYIDKAQKNLAEDKPVLQDLRERSKISPFYKDSDYMAWLKGLFVELYPQIVTT